MSRKTDSFLPKNYENILSYVYRYKDVSFEDKPFGELDALVFADLAYLPLETLIPEGDIFQKMTIGQACALYLSSLDAFELRRDISKALYMSILMSMALVGSKRYSTCLIEDFRHEFSKEDEIQFAGIQVKMLDDVFLVSFRGTDTSAVGWKEDFNMSYMDEVPGQSQALSLLRDSIRRHPEERYYLVGHSKGGNLADYAISSLDEDEQEYLIRAYLFDSPGLSEGMFDSPGHQRIVDKIDFFVPEDSIIGVLLSHERIDHVVRGDQSGDLFTAHDYFTWQVSDDRLTRADDRSPVSHFVELSVDEFLRRLKRDERQRIVDLIFSILEKMNIVSVTAIMDDTIGFLFQFLRMTKKENKEDQQLLKRGLKVAISSFKNNLSVYNRYQKKDKMKRREQRKATGRSIKS